VSHPDSGLLTLLNQQYGFQFQKHRKGFYRFEWRLKIGRRVMVLPFEVPYDGSSNRAQIAGMLGLTTEQFAAAESKPTTYSRSCLLFVLIVTQLHRSLTLVTREFRAGLKTEASFVLDEIEDSLAGCQLMGGIVDKCQTIANNVELSDVGARLLDISRSVKV